MTEVTNTEADKLKEKQMQRRGRIIAAALILSVSLPMLLAYILYHTGVGVPEGTISEGELLSPPQSFSSWSPVTVEGRSWSVSNEPRKRWRLIIPADRACTGYCEENLYLTRQVHIRLASEAYRVERIVLPLDGHFSGEKVTWLEQEHPGVRVLAPDMEAMMVSLAQTNVPDDPLQAGRYYLMDQEGYVMMAYGPEHSGGQLLEDIKRLLRYSYDN